MSDTRSSVKSMLEKGQDPKDFLIEVCKPECQKLQDKLGRCEVALKNMTNADPELSCMYPLRDWVTCIDACVLHSVICRCNPKFTPTLSETRKDSFHDYTFNQYQSKSAHSTSININAIYSIVSHS